MVTVYGRDSVTFLVLYRHHPGRIASPFFVFSKMTLQMLLAAMDKNKMGGYENADKQIDVSIFLL